MIPQDLKWRVPFFPSLIYSSCILGLRDSDTKLLHPISTFSIFASLPGICTHGPRNEPEMIRLSPDWLLAVSHPNQKGRVTGGHVWPPLRRITGSLSAPKTTNGSPPSLWQQPGGTLEGPQTGASEQMPIINVAIWRCQSCQSAVRGGRPSPRPVTGPLGWVKNYCPAVWLCVCQCVCAGLGGLGGGWVTTAHRCLPSLAWDCRCIGKIFYPSLWTRKNIW